MVFGICKLLSISVLLGCENPFTTAFDKVNLRTTPKIDTGLTLTYERIDQEIDEHDLYIEN
jgi:hypothetical protein